MFYLTVVILPCELGSGPRYQVLSHVFAHCASQKTHGHARIACVSRAILAETRFLTRATCKKV